MKKKMKKTSVLIVDDNENFRNTLSKVLDKKGYDTTTAESGFHALELMKAEAFDTVLLDIRMPVMNGVETYKKIKEVRTGTVVIIMTAFSVDDLIREAVKEGVYAVVRKPLDIEVVINMIEKAKNGALIAVVDDDPEICRTMKNILEKRGYSVITCATGEEAISLAKETQHNIFFIDIKLPLLNGLEVYTEIKKLNPNAVAVFQTAYREETRDLVKQALEKGAYACLYKPFDMEKVFEIIDEVFKKLK
jgi:two-component system, NtrC family, response regulator HydG